MSQLPSISHRTPTSQLLGVLALMLLLTSGLSYGQESQGLEPTIEPVPVEAPSDQSGTEATTKEPQNSLTEDFRSLSQGEEGTSNPNLVITVLAITLIFGGPVVVLIVIARLHYRAKNQRAQLLAEATLKALEVGRELPETLLEDKPQDRPEDYLRKGVKNSGLGIGIILGLSFLVGFEIGALGFVLVGIGASQLVLWKLDQRHSVNAG